MSDVIALVPEHLRLAIETPHAYENTGHNKPVWLIWKTFVVKGGPHKGLTYGPYLDSVCDSVHSALYHVGACLESPQYGAQADQHLFVERIPTNHRFASSLDDELAKLNIRQEPYHYKRTGD